MTEAMEVVPHSEQPLRLRNRDKMEEIRESLGKNISNAHLEILVTLGDRYQLDFFLKELWWVPGVGVIVSRDAYLKIAQRDPDYAGLTSCAVCQGDHFEMDPIEPKVSHKFGAERGAVIGAYAVVYHRKRRPAVCFADVREYKKPGAVWQTYTSAMIQKVAEVQALKRQFGINGLISEDEIGHSIPEPPPVNNKPSQTVEGKPAAPKTQAEKEKAWRDRMKTKEEILDFLAELKDQCMQLTGDEAGNKAFAEMLRIHGVESMHGFRNVGEARIAALDIAQRVENVRESMKPKNNEGKEDWVPPFGPEEQGNA